MNVLFPMKEASSRAYGGRRPSLWDWSSGHLILLLGPPSHQAVCLAPVARKAAGTKTNTSKVCVGGPTTSNQTACQPAQPGQRLIKCEPFSNLQNKQIAPHASSLLWRQMLPWSHPGPCSQHWNYWVQRASLRLLEKSACRNKPSIKLMSGFRNEQRTNNASALSWGKLQIS